MSNKQPYRLRVVIACAGPDWSAREADTHPDLPDDLSLDDSLVANGLMDTLCLAADLIQQHHGRGDDIDGATRVALASRIGTARVYLSQRRGRAQFHVPYTLDHAVAREARVVVEQGDRSAWLRKHEEARAERDRLAAMQAASEWTPPATVRVRPSDLPPKEPSK